MTASERSVIYSLFFCLTMAGLPSCSHDDGRTHIFLRFEVLGGPPLKMVVFGKPFARTGEFFSIDSIVPNGDFTSMYRHQTKDGPTTFTMINPDGREDDIVFIREGQIVQIKLLATEGEPSRTNKQRLTYTIAVYDGRSD